MDTTIFNITAEMAGENDLLQTIPNYLTNCTRCQPDNGIDFVMGNIGNLKVKVKRHSLTINKGSLTKWLKGNNLEMLSRNDTQLAIEKLSDYLHLPMHKASVLRFDYAINFSINHSLALYLPYLHTNGTYRRLEQDKGIYYKKNGIELCLYDKIAEIRSKREIIPNIYAGNVGRLEKRYLKNLPSYFKRDAITAELLYNEIFYKQIVQDLYNDYLNINKQMEYPTDLSKVKTKTDLNQMGIIALIEKWGGNTALINELTKNRKLDNINRSQLFDLKNAVLNCDNGKMPIAKNELIIELDKSIEDVISTFL